MTFRVQRSRSNPENFEVEYLENGTRLRNGVHGSQIGNHKRVFEWHKNVLPQMTIRGKGQGQTLKNVEVECLKTGTR